MSLGNSRLAEYDLQMFLIFGKISSSTECHSVYRVYIA